MTLRTKILAVATLLLLLFGVAVGVAVTLQESVNEEIGGLTDYHLPIAKAVAELDVATYEYELVLGRLLRAPAVTPAQLETARRRERELVAELTKTFARADALLKRAMVDKRLDVADRLEFARIEGRFDFIRRQTEPFTELGTRVIAAYAAGRVEEARALLFEFSRFEEVFGPDLAAIRGGLARVAESSAAETYRHEQTLRLLTIGLFAAAAIVGLAMSALLAGRIVAQLRTLVASAQAVEKGELGTSLPVASNDEVGQLTKAFNHMVGELRSKEKIKDTFGKYVDPKVVAQLIDESGESSAERRVVTVFFSDVKGFSSLSEQLTAQAIVNLLNRYFTAAADAVRAHHGVIDKYIGDAVMAYWAPPFVAGDAHAAQACLAALAQQAAVRALKADLHNILGLRRDVPDFRVRMGLATGEVVIGTIGAPTAKSYTVIGDVVNLASRLEGVNKAYGTDIIVAEETYRLAQDAVEARELDVIAVAGKSEPVKIFELLAPADGLDPAASVARERYSEALALYRGRAFDEADRALAGCLEQRPGDGPAAAMRRRIQRLRANPPAGDWDGVWRMSEK
jgi:adenylate cyclase